MRFVAVLLIVGVGLIVVSARTRAQAPQDQPPTFRASAQYIEVDVRATDRKGRVVRDLTKDDFVLMDDGKPQTISTATFVDLEVKSPVTRRLPDSVETDVASNAGTGRMWVMLLGGYGLRAQHVARQFVIGALGPNDEVAVIPVHGTMSSAQGFTRNRALMLAGIDRLQSDSPDEFVGDSVVRAYQVLEELCVRLGRVGGRRKAVVFFDPPKYFIPLGSPADAPRIFAQRDALRAATRNNVAVYVVSTEGLTTELSFPGLPPQLGPIVGMSGQRFLAEETGGDAIINSNNFVDGYQRFVRDTSHYYLLGYTPSVEHRDGEFHSINVRVNRPGLTVHARPGYYAPEAEPPAPKLNPPPQPDTPGLSPDALAALRLPLPMNGLIVDLAAAPFRGAAGNGSVLLSARVRGDGLVLGAGEPIEVGYRAITTEGKATPGAFYVIKLELTTQSLAAASTNGFQFVDWMSLAPGRHQLRFVVHQPNGKTGMVVGDVDVPDFKAPISVSGLVIASARLSAQPTLKMNEQMQKLLGAHPTPERSFIQSDTVSAYAEIYMNGEPPPDVTATVARLGQLNRPRIIAVSQSVAEPGRIGALIAIPIGELHAGDYVLTVEAKTKRRSASRQILFSVTDR